MSELRKSAGKRQTTWVYSPLFYAIILALMATREISNIKSCFCDPQHVRLHISGPTDKR